MSYGCFQKLTCGGLLKQRNYSILKSPEFHPKKNDIENQGPQIIKHPSLKNYELMNVNNSVLVYTIL